MKKITSISNRYQVPVISLVPFLLVTFGLAWGILALYIFLPDQMKGLFGELSGNHPLFYLAVYAPAVAAFIIIIYTNGIGGLRSFLSRLSLWRCSAAWYAFLIVGIPLVFYAGSAWKGSLFSDPFPFSSVRALIMALLLAAIKGPVEEFGWRGLALPLLQRRMTPFWAALVIGIVWGFWHTPAFLLSGTQQSQWSFTAFFVGCIALSIIVTPLFNESGGSIFLSALFHFMLMNPIFPDAQPYDTYIFISIALLTVIIKRESMFGRDASVTEIIPTRSIKRNSFTR